MHDLAQQLITYVKAAWRYRWYAAMISWIVAVMGWAAVARMPNQFEASARVYVDTQSVLRPLLSGLAVMPNVNQMLQMMSRTLISRPNIERVIRMADMDVSLQTPEDRENMVSSLSRRLTIRSAGVENLYTIAFTDSDPQLARRVVQSLLTMFVEGSLGSKRKDSDSAKRFIGEQLKAYNEKLIAADNAVTEFKREHMGLMGAEGRGYYARMAETEAALAQVRLELREAENSRDAIKNQLEGNTPVWLGEAVIEEPNPEIDGRVLALQQRLDNLRLNFTDQHPDIISINRMIEQLKEQKKKEAKTKKAPPVRGTVQVQNPVVQQLSVTLAEAEASVASRRARVAEYERRYNQLKERAHAVPQIEAEFKQLTRDYEVTRKNYEALLAKRESAQIAGEMEESTTIVDFRIIDPPQVPLRPKAPNRPLLMSIVLLAAIAAGAAIAFLLSQIRPTFRDERRLREISGLPVFGTVMMAWTESQISKRRRALAAFVCSFVGLLCAYGAIIAALTLTTVRI
jgi:polysaccharide chain length determinant protein (PEP-CTERM system associated)